MKEYYPYLILLLGVLIIAFLPVHSYPEKISYHRIDSTSVKPRYSVEPELEYTYYTNGGNISLGYDKYKVGDSIPVKTIIVIK